MYCSSACYTDSLLETCISITKSDVIQKLTVCANHRAVCLMYFISEPMRLQEESLLLKYSRL